MDRYKHLLKMYLAEKKPDYGDGDIQSLLGMLYDCYTSHNPIDNQMIRARFAELDSILEQLSWEDNDDVFSLTCTLCSEHARIAFMEGFHVGVRLVTEITESIAP